MFEVQLFMFDSSEQTLLGSLVRRKSVLSQIKKSACSAEPATRECASYCHLLRARSHLIRAVPTPDTI